MGKSYIGRTEVVTLVIDLLSIGRLAPKAARRSGQLRKQGKILTLREEVQLVCEFWQACLLMTNKSAFFPYDLSSVQMKSSMP